MQIVIVGGGQVGLGWPGLCRRHEVVVVDQDPRRGVFQSIDVEFLLGSGTNEEVLARAGVAGCGFFVAATGLDEVNIVACALARRLWARRRFAWCRGPILAAAGGGGLLREHVGVDRVIWPRPSSPPTSSGSSRPLAPSTPRCSRGGVALLEYRLDAGSALLAAPLSSLHLPRGALIVAVKRRQSASSSRAARPSWQPATR